MRQTASRAGWARARTVVSLTRRSCKSGPRRCLRAILHVKTYTAVGITCLKFDERVPTQIDWELRDGWWWWWWWWGGGTRGWLDFRGSRQQNARLAHWLSQSLKVLHGLCCDVRNKDTIAIPEKADCFADKRCAQLTLDDAQIVIEESLAAKTACGKHRGSSGCCQSYK